MAIKIIRAGILDTIQDKGRYGHQHLGINPGGAMDKYAMQITNMLTGNDPDEAVIEMHFPAPVFLFEKCAIIALGGADFSASINGEPVPAAHPVLINKNDVLQFHRPVNGTRAYLSLRGGLSIPDWLGSKSTNLKASAGGFSGRALQKGDIIDFRHNEDYTALARTESFFIFPWCATVDYSKADITDIAILCGHEWNSLSPTSKMIFTEKPFIITRHSDRMGYRLLSEPLVCTHTAEMISTAVSFGTIQLLPEGKLIVLMADHQTTGGYPRIGHVISAHHSRLAQLSPGQAVQFHIVSLEEAESLQTKQQQHLLQLKNACTFRLEAFLKK